MTKILKRVAAMGAAVMMMASISAMGASAYEETYNNYTLYKTITGKGRVTCTGEVTGSSTTTVKASTSLNTYSGGVSVNIVIYYKNPDGGTSTTGTGNGGQSGISATKSITAKTGTYLYAKNKHMGYGEVAKEVRLYKE